MNLRSTWIDVLKIGQYTKFNTTMIIWAWLDQHIN